jgi:hypothetical protein
MDRTALITIICASACAAAQAGCDSDSGGLPIWDGIAGDAAPDSTMDSVWPEAPADTVVDGPVDECVERARWIYLIDSDGTLVQFRPDTLEFFDVGPIGCAAAGATGQPFSMSVDRDANAWILHSPALGMGPGSLYKVSTADASCESTTFTPNQHGFELFGMGFVSDAEGSDEETLYVAGGSSSGIGTGSSSLGWIDMTTLTLTPIGPVPGWPELTGTGLGELWGFFPHSGEVHKLNKYNGEVLQTYPLSIPAGNTEAWAFAFWGGDFYIFHKLMLDASTNVFKLEMEDGTTTEVVPDSGYRIVGAGVSTCAPTELI